MNPFEHVKNLHTKKKRWEDFNDEEKKNFNVFIINKTLSFNPNYLSIVNYVQKYSAGQITPKEVFNIYFSLLPTNFRFYRWIKGKKSDKDKEKAKHLAVHFKCSTREAEDYMEILDKKTIKTILRNYDTKVSRKAI